MIERKLNSISELETLLMHEFSIVEIDADEEKLVIVGDRGYRHYYRVELIFLDVAYIACATSFIDMGTFQFKIAEGKDRELIMDNIHEKEYITVYSFEEDISRWERPPSRKARKFFIASGSVEITVYYGGDSLDELFKL